MKAAVDAPPIAVDPPSVRKAKSGVTGYAHGGASTYFTLPAWFIVYHAEEYAAAIGAARPSAFPYFSSIAQYWSYYRGVCDQTCSQYKFDFGSHLMLGAIGASFTIENGLKGVYENSVGRATERWSGVNTDEDRFAVQTAVEYGRFLHMKPWYDFPFKTKLFTLWSQTPRWGPHPVRKWERRFALSVEYGVKAAYGWTIRQGAKALYGDEDEWVYAWAERVPDAALRDPRVRA